MKALMIVALSAGLLAPPVGAGTGESSDPAAARAAYERFKALQGAWEGRSTKGWVESLRYDVIAAGSAVLETSMDAHPGEAMATTFFLDGDRLLLTHYCVAKNQPRLVASRFEDGGRTVVFTFLDATNLPSRDRGHMDKAVFTFEGTDRVTSRWTWYQDGRETWFETIVQTRVR